jgi:serine-type D-Ala-D-Ala carboxypeptidase/endopeptidase
MKPGAYMPGAVLALTLALALQPAAARGSARDTARNTASQRPPPANDVQRVLEQRRENAGIVGVAAATIDAEASRTYAAGTRSVGGAPVDGRTMFETGSVSKAFTGTLLALMVIRGEVGLQDPVSMYLPEAVVLKSRGREISLLDLATHTSGLPRLPLNLMPADRSNPYAEYDAERLYTFLSSFAPAREPGVAYEYSNLGAGLLGHVLSLRAGMPYEELVRERILQPLGMHDTRLTPDHDIAGRLAASHAADGTPVPNWDMNILAGAGGWLSTAEDMLRFVAAAVRPPQGPLGGAFALAMAPRHETGRPGLRVGLGWHVLERNGRTIVWHNGQTGGYHAFIGVDPDRGTGALILANGAVPIDDLGMQLLGRE